MLLKINKLLSSDELSLKVNESFVMDDKEFLEETGLRGDISLKGQVRKTDGSLIIAGTITYTFADRCARCLKEFYNTVEAKFQAAIVKSLDEESDLIQLLMTDGNIKMDEEIKQVIYLSMPMKSLCSKDCKGICPNCGINLNDEECQCEKNLTDPRFDKLRDLFKN